MEKKFLVKNIYGKLIKIKQRRWFYGEYQIRKEKN